jgi:hypothetical protein
MRGISMRENREIPCSPAADGGGTRRKGQGRNPPMNEQGKSHRSRVPTKPPNKVGSSTAEEVEGQDLAKENVVQQNTHRTQCRVRVNSELDSVRRIARRDKTPVVLRCHQPLVARAALDANIRGKNRMR